MKLLKLTALASCLLAVFLSFSSCERDEEKDQGNLYMKDNLPLTGAQSVPASASSATGSVDVSYDKRTKVLFYTIRWNGLTGTPTIGIFGPASPGFAALTSTGTLAPALQTITLTAAQNTISNSYSGSLFVDNTKISEQALLNYLYYVRISTAAYPAGELRAQIKFQ